MYRLQKLLNVLYGTMPSEDIGKVHQENFR